MSQRVVRIDWVDAHTEHAWTEFDEVTRISMPIIRTIGYLLRESKDFYIVSTSICDIHKLAVDPLLIPKSAVKKIKTVKL